MIYTGKSIVNLPAMIEKNLAGKLYPIEPPELPFDINRIFWVTDVPPKGVRGGHAHIECRQFYICMRGCIGVRWNTGEEEGEFFLKEGQGVLIETLIWTAETFMTGEDILLVLCSSGYSSGDYINSVEKLREYNKEHGRTNTGS